MNEPSSEETTFIETVVYVPATLADAVSNFITENISGGVVFEDTENSNMLGVRFYVPSDAQQDFRSAFKEYLSQITVGAIPEIQEREIPSVDWEEVYRDSVKLVVVGNDVLIRPPWAETTGKFSYELIIEPKMAFGTGQHVTTRSCLEIIRKRFEHGWTFLDFGCGSGILSLLADKLGAAYIKAVDHDKIAVSNCKENFEINGVKTRFSIQFGSFEKTKSDRPFDFVSANLNGRDIVDNLDQLLYLTKDNGLLLLSGLLENNKTEIDEALQSRNCRIVEFMQTDEWLTYCINK